MKIKSKIAIGIGMLIYIIMLASCSHTTTHKEMGGYDRDMLKSIDDSIDSHSKQARQMIDKGLEQAQDSLAIYELYARMGKYYCLSATPDSLIPYINATIAYCMRQPESPRINTLLAYAYNCRALNLHNFHKNPQQVIELYKKSYACLAKSDQEEQMPRICANLGDAYMFNNQLPEASGWYRRALFLTDSLNLPKRENITLYLGLANIYQQLNDFDTALKYYQQTARYRQEMSISMQAYYLNNYGTYYYYTHNYKASLAKFVELKQFLQKVDKTDTFDMYLCKLNMADVYLHLDSIPLSEKYLDEVEPFMTQNGDQLATYYCNTIRIGQAVKKGDIQSIPHILSSEQNIDNIAFNLRQIRNQYLRRYYELTGNYQKAYQNLIEDDLLNDSLEHNRTKMRASEIMERLAQDTIKLHHKLQMEHKNAIIQESQNKILIAVALIIVLILLIVLWAAYTRKRETQKRMEIMMLKLGNARNRISPHFVFNVLNNKIIHSEKQDANELLELTKLIRANLDLSCRLSIPLAEELDFVEQYINVERHQLGEDFHFSIQIDKGLDTSKIQIPSMLIQILAENSIVHGLRGWDGEKKLTISIQQRDKGPRDKGYYISVTDNGPGIDITKTGKQRTGLHIVSKTIATVNAQNKGKNKMKFTLQNIKDDAGNTIGCQACIYMPEHIKWQ